MPNSPAKASLRSSDAGADGDDLLSGELRRASANARAIPPGARIPQRNGGAVKGSGTRVVGSETGSAAGVVTRGNATGGRLVMPDDAGRMVRTAPGRSEGVLVTLRLGYKASAEQFGPVELADFAVDWPSRPASTRCSSPTTCSRGGTTAATPRPRCPGSGAVGARTERVLLGTSVLTPTFRYHPAVIAQAFATLGVLYPGRVDPRRRLGGVAERGAARAWRGRTARSGSPGSRRRSR